MEILISEFEDLAVWFAPDYEDNRDKPFADQARIKTVPMTGRDKLKLDQAPIVKTKASRKQKDLQAMFAEREWMKVQRVVKERCVEFHGWVRRVKSADGTSKVEPITDAKTWIETLLASNNAALIGLIDQVYGAIMDASILDEGLTGESTSPHDSR